MNDDLREVLFNIRTISFNPPQDSHCIAPPPPLTSNHLQELLTQYWVPYPLPTKKKCLTNIRGAGCSTTRVPANPTVPACVHTLGRNLPSDSATTRASSPIIKQLAKERLDRSSPRQREREKSNTSRVGRVIDNYWPLGYFGGVKEVPRRRLLGFSFFLEW